MIVRYKFYYKPSILNNSWNILWQYIRENYYIRSLLLDEQVEKLVAFLPKFL